jgi:hypothetical protein
MCALVQIKVKVIADFYPYASLTRKNSLSIPLLILDFSYDESSSVACSHIIFLYFKIQRERESGRLI